MTQELTAADVDRLEWLLGTLEAKRLVGETLTEREASLADALERLNRAEREARGAFSAFYSALSPVTGETTNEAGGQQGALPLDVAARISAWVEARRVWDERVAGFLSEPLPVPAPPRTGTRLRARLPETLRLPTAVAARDMMALFFAPHRWQADADGLAVTARRNGTEVRLECDDVTGLSPDAAIRQIAKHGASVAQTFFALIGLWMERGGAGSPETYLTASASDLLRYQQRKETPRGGYHADDVLAKGRDIYLLSRISVPASSARVSPDGRREARTLSLGRLLSLDSLEMARLTVRDESGAEKSAASVVQFRYHLGREVHRWVCGEGRYARLSGRLLTYHPVRQKYQILLGFCLACYDRAHPETGSETRRLPLPLLLDLAAIPVPDRRIAEFLSSIEEALDDLRRDAVLPGLRLQKPPDWTDLLARRRTRDIIAASVVTFPRLPAHVALPEPSETPAADAARHLTS